MTAATSPHTVPQDGLGTAGGPRLTLWNEKSRTTRKPFKVLPVAEVQRTVRAGEPKWKVTSTPLLEDCPGVLAVGVVGVREIDPWPAAWEAGMGPPPLRQGHVLIVYFPVEN